MNGLLIEYAKQLREMLDLRNVAEVYGLIFDRKGFTRCPFHSEKTASFSIKEKWGHCFGCGENADAVKLTQQLFGIRFSDAIIKLNSDFNCGIPIDRKPTLREQREMQRKNKERMAAQRAEQERKEEWEAEYWRRWDRWITYDKNKRLYAPMNPDEPLHPLYVEALHNIGYASYLIDCLPPLQDYTILKKRGDDFG